MKLKIKNIVCLSFLLMLISCGSSSNLSCDDEGDCRSRLDQGDSGIVFPASSMMTKWKVGDMAFGDGDLSITLPLRSGYTYNFNIDWGDGTISEIASDTDTDTTHIYSIAGVYEVKIYGILEAWYFNNGGDKNKLIEVVEFGDVGWKDLRNAFYGCTNLTDFSGGVTTAVTNMGGMFRNASSLVNLDLSSFRADSLYYMSNMFEGVNSLASLDLSSLITSSAIKMDSMFEGASALTTLDISSFVTSNVTHMNGMFDGVSSLSSLDLSHFNTEKVISMASMFSSMTSLTSLNISSFDTEKVTGMNGMFENASALTSVDISSFVTTELRLMHGMFKDASSLVSLDLSHFDTSGVTKLDEAFRGTSSLINIDTTDWDVSSVSSFTSIFSSTNAGLVVTCNQGGSPGTGTFYGKACN